MKKKPKILSQKYIAEGLLRTVTGTLNAYAVHKCSETVPADTSMVGEMMSCGLFPFAMTMMENNVDFELWNHYGQIAFETSWKAALERNHGCKLCNDDADHEHPEEP